MSIEIDLVRMVRDLNRGQGGRSLMTGDSVRHLEMQIERTLRAAKPGDTVTFDLEIDYGRGARPISFIYQPTVAGRALVSATQQVDNR